MVRNITVYLDNERRNFMDTVRCGFIVAENEDGEESYHNDLIDQSEYSTVKDLVDDVVGVFNVHRDAVWIAS